MMSIEDEINHIFTFLSHPGGFNLSMAESRKMWHPQCGKGSQDSSLEIYKSINRAVEKVVKEREEESLKDGGEVIDSSAYYPYMLKHNISEKKAQVKKSK